MTTVNMKKVGNRFEPITIEDDHPFAEYNYVDDRVQSQSQKQQTQTKDKKKNEQQDVLQHTIDNIDQIFHGANIVLDLTDKVMEGFGGLYARISHSKSK
jgi:hypothetical protein